MARKSDGWMWLTPTERIKPLPDGRYHHQIIEDVGKTHEIRRQMRQDAKGKIARMTEAKGTPLRMIAAVPKSMNAEMLRECGHDPEKKDMWLRDHPECLVVEQRSADLPAKRTYSSRHHKRRS